jgi:hypothetical protein
MEMREYYYELLDDVSVQEDDQEEETLSVDSELIEGKNEATEEEDEDEEEDKESKKSGPRLIYDVVRRISQPLGLHLDDLDGRIIDIEKGVVRLIPVTERAKQLFGEKGAEKFVQELGKASAQGVQLKLLADYSNVELTTKKMLRREGNGDPSLPFSALVTVEQKGIARTRF